MVASTLVPAGQNGTSTANGDNQKKTAKSKNALRRQKAKAKKAHGDDQSERAGSVATTGYGTETDAETDNEAIVTPSATVDDLAIDTSDPAYAQFADIFGKFQGTDAQEEAEQAQVSLAHNRKVSRRLTGLLELPGRRTEKGRDYLFR